MNKAWLAAALTAATLLAWLKLPALDGSLARAGPKTCATASCTPPPGWPAAAAGVASSTFLSRRAGQPRTRLKSQGYGYRRLHAALVRDREQARPELVRQLMRELGLVACQPRPWRPSTTCRGLSGRIPTR
jgi:hypothetical protein